MPELPERRVDITRLREEVADLSLAVNSLVPAVTSLLPDAHRITAATKRLLIGFLLINLASILAVLIWVTLWVNGEVHGIKGTVDRSRKIVECVLQLSEPRDNVHILGCEQSVQ
jgi:hypothetical protein